MVMMVLTMTMISLSLATSGDVVMVLDVDGCGGCEKILGKFTKILGKIIMTYYFKDPNKNAAIQFLSGLPGEIRPKLGFFDIILGVSYNSKKIVLIVLISSKYSWKNHK